MTNLLPILAVLVVSPRLLPNVAVRTHAHVNGNKRNWVKLGQTGSNWVKLVSQSPPDPVVCPCKQGVLCTSTLTLSLYPM